MSSNRKGLKLISFIQLAAALWAVVLGCIAIGGADLAADEAGLAAVRWVQLDGVCLIALAVLTLLCAALGIRGANRPSKLGAHRVLGVLVVLVGMLCAYFSTAGSTIPACESFSIVAAIASIIVDGMCRREAEH